MQSWFWESHLWKINHLTLADRRQHDTFVSLSLSWWKTGWSHRLRRVTPYTGKWQGPSSCVPDLAQSLTVTPCSSMCTRDTHHDSGQNVWAECFVCLMMHIYTGCHLSNTINTSRTMQIWINTSWIQTQLLINTSNTHIGWEYKTQCHRYANKILWWCMMGETATTCFLQGSLSKAIEFTNSLSTLEREWGMYIHIGVKRRAIAPATLKWGYQVPRDIRLRGSPLPRVFDGPPESQGALLLSCQSLSYVHCSDQNCRRQITGSFQRPVRGGEGIVSHIEIKESMYVLCTNA